MNALDLLTTRRSVLAKHLVEPGPNEAEIEQILHSAHRVPDHGKIGPWRFVVFRGEARRDFGTELAEIFKEDNSDATEQLLDFQSKLLLRAPLVIAVVSNAGEHMKVPEWEQVLSAGAACQNILLAASALSYGAQWLTEWPAYHKKVHALLGMKADHQIAGFMYIGSYAEKPSERVRPSLEERIQYWKLNQETT